mgnify:CR=1 FL=1
MEEKIDPKNMSGEKVSSRRKNKIEKKATVLGGIITFQIYCRKIPLNL